MLKETQLQPQLLMSATDIMQTPTQWCTVATAANISCWGGKQSSGSFWLNAKQNYTGGGPVHFWEPTTRGRWGLISSLQTSKQKDCK